MSIVTIEIVQDKITPDLQKKIRSLSEVPQKAYIFWRAKTPIRTGSARRNTKFQTGNTINADYPYAGKLNKGFSKQAPIGMLIPTIDYIKKIVRNIF